MIPTNSETQKAQVGNWKFAEQPKKSWHVSDHRPRKNKGQASKQNNVYFGKRKVECSASRVAKQLKPFCRQWYPYPWDAVLHATRTRLRGSITISPTIFSIRIIHTWQNPDPRQLQLSLPPPPLSPPLQSCEKGRQEAYMCVLFSAQCQRSAPDIDHCLIRADCKICPQRLPTDTKELYRSAWK